LTSLRVGSRPLSNVLPDARDACDPLRHAMGEILAAAKSALSDGTATDSLAAYVSPRIAELESELSSVAGKQLSVKMRLSLEESVTRLSHELDNARGLFDLLAESIGGRPMRLDVLEVSRQGFAAPPSGSSWPHEMLVATLSHNTESELEVEVNPRVFTSLLSLCVELVANPTDPSQIPHVALSTTADGGCHISIERRPDAKGEDLVMVRRGVIAPTLPCALAAARASGAVLDFDPRLPRLSLTFAKAFPGSVAGKAG
jgi:hypothetical protein